MLQLWIFCYAGAEPVMWGIYCILGQWRVVSSTMTPWRRVNVYYIKCKCERLLNQVSYQLSPQDAALFNDCEIAMLVRLSLWLLAWKSSWPISLMCVEITTKNPREKPIMMYPSPYLPKEEVHSIRMRDGRSSRSVPRFLQHFLLTTKGPHAPVRPISLKGAIKGNV